MNKKKIFFNLIAAFVIFTLASFVAAQFSNSTLCDCFSNKYGSLVAYILGFLFFGFFCFREYKLKNEENQESWYEYFLWIVLAVILYIIIFLEIIYNGDKFEIGGPYGLDKL